MPTAFILTKFADYDKGISVFFNYNFFNYLQQTAWDFALCCKTLSQAVMDIPLFKKSFLIAIWIIV